MIVLDTNVVSEMMKPKPNDGVARWVAGQPGPTVFVTSITQAEVFYGVELLPAGKRRTALEKGARALFESVFAGRILSFASETARAYADIAAARRSAGRPITTVDAQIAAIARSYRATLATRNVADFEGCGVDVVNPWEAQAG